MASDFTPTNIVPFITMLIATSDMSQSLVFYSSPILVSSLPSVPNIVPNKNSMTTRARNGILMPKIYNVQIILYEPLFVQEALHHTEWVESMKKEY